MIKREKFSETVEFENREEFIEKERKQEIILERNREF